VAERRSSSHPAPLAEWAVGVAGAAAFLGMIAVLAWNGLRDEGAPPDVRIALERVVAGENGHVVEFVALNRGDRTAAGLLVVGELSAEGVLERRETTIDYLPPHSRRSGGFIFESDPTQGDLRLFAESYADP
jgi:uncharacterized protein (TIGR02588 family)